MKLANSANAYMVASLIFASLQCAGEPTEPNIVELFSTKIAGSFQNGSLADTDTYRASMGLRIKDWPLFGINGSDIILTLEPTIFYEKTKTAVDKVRLDRSSRGMTISNIKWMTSPYFIPFVGVGLTYLDERIRLSGQEVNEQEGLLVTWKAGVEVPVSEDLMKFKWFYTKNIDTESSRYSFQATGFELEFNISQIVSNIRQS